MSLVLALLLAYVGLLAVVYVGQGRLLYLPELPTRALTATPADIGLAYEDVELITDDGVRLHGWWIPHPRPRAALLHLHGNAGNVSHRLELIRILHDLGLAVLIFDYRGYGRSEGKPTEAGTQRDALAAWRHLTEVRGFSPERIVLHGQSLGAALAAWLASRQRAGALILESAFTSVPELAAELYPWLPARHLARFRYDTRAALSAVRCPVLVVHSRQDEIVPYAHGLALYAAAPGPKDLLVLRGDHNSGFVVSGRVYVDGLDAFLHRHLGEDVGARITPPSGL
ncbi:MAG: alpha/beta hydrolase [Burkholderiales bacterium]|nr:alpha/beta hydrolase [Burkholderiales bacterium]